MSTSSIPTAAEVLDEYLAFIEEPRIPDGKFHPSSLWMCDRQAVMVARGETQSNPPDTKTMRVFKIGKMIHELIQTAMSHRFDKVGFTHLETEFSFDEEHVTGHGDDALYINFLTPEEEVIVYEYKSTRSLAKQRSSKQASPHHVKQGATYCAALAAKGHKVKELHVIYFEKTNLDIEEFVIPYDPEWRVQVDAKVDALAPYLDKPGEYPACTGEKWLKSYCPFFPICHEQNPSKPSEVFSWKT